MKVEKTAAASGSLSVSKSRSGRRPLSAATLLRKDRDGTLFKNRRVSIDLDNVRDKTLDALADWTKKNRYAQVFDDIETITDKVAGEYGKNSAGYDLQGKTEVQGLPVAIENKPGSVRSGKNEDGTSWETKFKSPYGYIEGTKGADGEEVDAYVGPDKDSTQAFIVHQKKADGSHDEDTVMLGYKTKGDAKTDILQHYDDTSLIGGIDQMSVDVLKGKLEAAGDKPISKIARLITEDEVRARAKAHLRMQRLAARRPPDPEAWSNELKKTAVSQHWVRSKVWSARLSDKPRVQKFVDRMHVGAHKQVSLADEAASKSLSIPLPVEGSEPLTAQHKKLLDRFLTHSNHRLKRDTAAEEAVRVHTAFGKKASLDYRDGDPPGMTGIPAQMGRKKWEGPSRVMDDPYPNPKIENRQEIQETKHIGALSPAEGFEDIGKTADSLGRDRALGDERKSWEGPTRDDVGASPLDRHRLRAAGGSESVSISDLSPEVKVAELAQAIRGAFLEELFEIADANGVAAWRGDFEKFASSQLLDDLVKEALFQQLAGGLRRGLVGGMSPQGVPMKGVLSGLKGTGHRIEQAGTRMMTSPAQRIQAAGASAGEASQLAQQAERFGVKAPGVAKRIGGEAVQTAGKHVSHASPLQLAVNPVGTVVGGGIEGATRGAGRELVRSTGMAGQAGAGGARAGLGRAMQAHAGKAGFAGEMATLGALGGMLHVPLSGAGALGTGMAHASPMVGHGLAALGQVGGHMGADALGTLAHKASRFIPLAARATGRLAQTTG